MSFYCSAPLIRITSEEHITVTHSVHELPCYHSTIHYKWPLTCVVNNQPQVLRHVVNPSGLTIVSGPHHSCSGSFGRCSCAQCRRRISGSPAPSRPSRSASRSRGRPTRCTAGRLTKRQSAHALKKVFFTYRQILPLISPFRLVTLEVVLLMIFL